MRRSPFKQRRFTTRLKHRLKLNVKYDPRNRIQLSLNERESPAITEFLKQWANLDLWGYPK